MKVIGILGGMGAGKSTVVALWNEIQPIITISADVIGHDILLKGNPAYEPILEAFGSDILDDRGEIIRKKLGERAFVNIETVTTLNNITHPLIVEEIKRQIKQAQITHPGQYIILEAALLLEAGLDRLTDYLVAVYTDIDVRIQRVKQRNQELSEEHILQRFKAQKEWKELEAVADYIIDNSVSLDYTRIQIKKILQELH